MYCPRCLNNSLFINERGVVHIVVNGRQMDTGRFLYNIESGNKEEMYQAMNKKLNEFFNWLSGFQNQEELMQVELCSSDFSCDNKCPIGVNQKFSVLDVLISRGKLQSELEELGKKYSMKIEIVKPNI